MRDWRRKMSKELEALKRLYKHSNYGFGKYSPDKDYELVELALKALEIIKKKRVDLEFLFEEWEEENWEFALENYNMNHEIELTQEEYDLLKEVLL